MECPKCQFENREGAKFCLKCGEKLELSCPKCGKELSLLAKFCDECGQRLEEVINAEKTAPELDGERKHITVLFSDMSGYTAMSERLDPEDVKEITSHIFSQISKVIGKYEGFVEKFVGDAVMALFGVPKAHEDDPVRAIRAAIEIHKIVASLSPELEEKVGRPLSMHTGINTGLVVTGEVDMEKGTHGVAGDSINLASRLSGLANPGEIFVTPDTYRQAEGHFTFEILEPTTVKGKTEPVQFYKVISQKKIPVTTRRLSGVRADLVGRKFELTELREAIEVLGTGKGGIFSICGDAGTGKSRLVEEFKAQLNFEKIKWLEGHAYAYAQNIPYFPLIDLLRRAFHIEDGDTREEVRQKIESEVEDLVEKNENIAPYIGSLFSLSYPEIEEVSPEFWKSRLQDAVKMILTALARKAPTIYFLEDLHWADPSFVELLRHVLIELQQPAIVLCVYRPVFNLLTTQQSRSIAKVYHEIRLQDLSSSESQDMLESLLKTDRIPSDLRRFVQDKAEGNPFYLEELVNSLIDSKTLIRHDVMWKLTKPFDELDISTTISGVISSRLDRLKKEPKRIIQEASVIGRSFQKKILASITSSEDGIEDSLDTLVKLDLILTSSEGSDAVYIFKHALIQEIVYNSLLRKMRKAIHERIGLAMERSFQHRISEFYETLAYHFTQAKSRLKATDYLMKSGKKSLKKFAVEEADRYYRKAYNQLTLAPNGEIDDTGLLVELLNEWALVFYYRGDFKGMERLLEDNLESADAIGNKNRSGRLYAWLGFAQFCREKNKSSYQVLLTALQRGEDADDMELICCACTWLTWTCAELGLYEEGIEYGLRAQTIAADHGSEAHIYDQTLSGMGEIYFFRGDVKKPLEIGRQLVEYGRKNANSRSIVNGYITIGHGRMNAGDYATALENYNKAYLNAKDPFYFQWPKFFIGMSYSLESRFDEAEQPLKDVLAYSEEFGCEALGMAAQVWLAVILVSKGELARGLKELNRLATSAGNNGRFWANSVIEHIQGTIYLRLLRRESSLNLWGVLRNMMFLIKTIPRATFKAETHFKQSVSIASEIGSSNMVGQASLDLGRLYKMKNDLARSREYIQKAIEIFQDIGASVHLQNAKNERIE